MSISSESPSWTLAAPSVKITHPSLESFKFPPSSLPATLPPPPDHPTLAHPFTIPPEIYNALLSPTVPITVALVYASIVTYLNSVNASRKWKPWAFSRTRVFKTLVILHNILLAAYSGWTFIGMLNGISISFERPRGEDGVAGMLDALCKFHGPRGIGNAATYNGTIDGWGFSNKALHLAPNDMGPLSTDVGRLWNEGLAFYGWLFYLSKFYEVVDTMIILLKGKKSSFLQTYHHAGAMLCMWAGIRYMSPPIWMFVFVNSGIHTIMYTFYLCSALRIPVPKWFKQTLTSLQITQFVVGTVYAFLHLFIAYQIPVKVPYIYHLGEAVSKIASALPSDASSASSTAFATASAGIGSWLKKVAFRAAGREGLAENVLNDQGQTFGIDAVHAAEDFVAREETRFRDELQWVRCLDTSGQTFAILLNCVYLAPLTWLFVQFFITSYMKRLERRRSSTGSDKTFIARESFGDASKGVARRMSEAFQEMHTSQDSSGDNDEAILDEADMKGQLKDAAVKTGKKLKQGAENAKNVVGKFDIQKVREGLMEDLEKMKNSVLGAGEERQLPQSMSDDLQVKAKQTKDRAERLEETSASSQQNTESKSSSESEQSQQRSPNESGIAVEEARDATATTSEKEKKEEDRIIDDSQTVRDVTVTTNGNKGKKSKNGGEDSADSSKVRSGTSFADVAKNE